MRPWPMVMHIRFPRAASKHLNGRARSEEPDRPSTHRVSKPRDPGPTPSAPWPHPVLPLRRDPPVVTRIRLQTTGSAWLPLHRHRPGHTAPLGTPQPVLFLFCPVSLSGPSSSRWDRCEGVTLRSTPCAPLTDEGLLWNVILSPLIIRQTALLPQPS